MIDPQFRSDHEQHSIKRPPIRELQLLHQKKPSSQVGQFQDGSSEYSTWKTPKTSYPGALSEITHSSAKKQPSGELSCELGLAILDNPRRVCRICQRHFSSGRALGGHMRVHGPLFQPAGSKRKLSSEWKDFEGRLGLKAMDVGHGGSSSPQLFKNTSEKGETEDDVLSFFSESDGEGVTDKIKEFDDVEDNSSECYGYTEVVDADHLYSSSKKKPLCRLRHNPKRSRRFADDDFAMELLFSGQAANATGSSFSSLEKPRVCSECGKAFWSWKALFGHMRCHPEREWRGILRPEVSSVHEGQRYSERKPVAKTFKESSDNEVESDVEDTENHMEGGGQEKPWLEENGVKERVLHLLGEGELTDDMLAILQRENSDHEMFAGEESKDLAAVAVARYNDWNPCWPTAGKRSRRKSTEAKAESMQQVNSFADEEEPALTSESTSLVEHGEEIAFETPNFLLMLAEAARKIEHETRVKKSLLQLCPPMPYSSTKPGPEGNEMEKGRGKPVFLFDAPKQSVAATSSANGILVKYECSTCKKSFNSHQALGGHRASHRKMKGCFARTSLEDEMGLGLVGVGEELSHHLDHLATWQVDVQEVEHLDRKGRQIKGGHECSVCHRVFSTGQALGGHKRCHYSGEKVAEAASITSSNKQQLSEEAHSSSKFDKGGSILDLNMPAFGENEDVCASTELHLYHANLDDDGDGDDDDNAEETLSKQQEGLLSAYGLRKDAALGGQNRSSWELQSSWSAVAPCIL